MKLAVFRALASKANRLSESSASAIPLLQRIQDCASESSCFQGVELSSSQISKTVIDQCSSLNVQVLCKLTPNDTDDAFRQLDDLSLKLSKVEEKIVGDVVRLVVVEEPLVDVVSTTTLDYLSDVLPVAAQFMETHPTIGKLKGERNAHGNPLDNHVLGVCHRLHQRSVSQNELLCSNGSETLQHIMDILDVFPPTRLSLDTYISSILETAVHGKKEEMNAWDLEPLIQGIDHFECEGWMNPRDNDRQDSFHEQVWNWQKEVKVNETYASCSAAATAELLRDYFHSSIG
ncbi:unnamed protein product [Cylindrotheca closterium]|uniref:Uncharacterized protein n=1 Tax=Cylindrotheca closterium TaxID=2856 RepID=A0AAD2CJ99_9STRA|nr:unnamed protein product [Cylindrotheca closterium]